MTQLAVLLPAMLGLLFVAWSVRLAARITGIKHVGWKLCLVFALILFLLGLVRKASGFVWGAHLPPLAGFVVGTGLTLAFGAWFFGRYAADPAGRALGWKAGAKLTSCAFLIVLTPAVVFLVIGSMVQA